MSSAHDNLGDGDVDYGDVSDDGDNGGSRVVHEAERCPG